MRPPRGDARRAARIPGGQPRPAPGRRRDAAGAAFVGRGRAAWLVMSGERVPARQAEAWGLVEFVVDDLEQGIEQVAGRLAGQSPNALREIKRLLYETRDARERREGVRGVRPLPRLRGRPRGRRRLPREAAAQLGRPVKAVVLRAVDGDLAVEDVPDPEGESVLDVRAAGINFLDVLIRRGRYPQMPEFPHVLGSEVAGDLDGRRVLALPRGSGGGYAERVQIDPRWTFELPERASYAEGASFLTDVPDRVHPARAPGAPGGRRDGPRPRRRRAESASRRSRSRSSSARVSSRRRAATRSGASRSSTARTRHSATTSSATCAWTSCTTRSAARSSRGRSSC